MISSKAQEYRDELVKKLCEAMENGTAPWQRTWTDGDAPFNAVSGRAYHGVNTINLALRGQELGHPEDPRWLTFDQAKEKGWHVKAGEKGTHVEFYKFDERPKVDEFGDPVLDEDGKQEVQKTVLVRNYVVFHASQIEGISPYVPKARNPIETSEKAERILQESGAEIRHGGNEAFYNPTDDYIQVPERGQFKSQADYYSTTLHELGHWTGHPSRLNRETSSDMNSETYAKEELVAEITSMFVSAETGIPQTQEHFDNHAAYVDHWVKAVKEDPNALFRAVNQAQKASEEILKYERVREREQEEKQTREMSEFKTEITLLNGRALLKKIVTEADIAEGTSQAEKADRFRAIAMRQGVFITGLKEPQDSYNISQLRDVMSEAGLREKDFNPLLKVLIDKGQIQLQTGESQSQANEDNLTTNDDIYRLGKFTLAGNSLKDFETTKEEFDLIMSRENQQRGVNQGVKPVLTEQTIRDMKLIEGDTKVFLKPRVDGQQYKGKILHVDESQGYCVQQVGRQSLVVHRLEKMEEVPKIGDSVKISYGTNNEKAKISVQEERHHGLRR